MCVRFYVHVLSSRTLNIDPHEHAHACAHNIHVRVIHTHIEREIKRENF